jgi:phosphoribosylaminoimidazole-succinocarboxamide synthase
VTDGSSFFPSAPGTGPGAGPGVGLGPALVASDLALPNARRGKVRDVYDLPPAPGRPPALLVVATDRISAFDVVMPTPVPGKGRLLTAMAAFWMDFVERAGLSRTHLLSTDAGLVPEGAFLGARTTREDLRGRVMIARRCRVIPVECVVRGYLEGSGWAEYQRTGAVCGVGLPPGLRRCGRLPGPIFTPATKEEQGRHDQNIPFEQACALVGEGLMRTLRDRSLAIYTAAAGHALERGIIIADTKFEFGLEVDEGGAPVSTDPILIDEALTPDSSRFWPAHEWDPGRPQRSFDKQYLREYLETLVERGVWNKSAPGPDLPEPVVRATLERYEDARRRLTE